MIASHHDDELVWKGPTRTEKAAQAIINDTRQDDNIRMFIDAFD